MTGFLASALWVKRLWIVLHLPHLSGKSSTTQYPHHAIHKGQFELISEPQHFISSCQNPRHE